MRSRVVRRRGVRRRRLRDRSTGELPSEAFCEHPAAGGLRAAVARRAVTVHGLHAAPELRQVITHASGVVIYRRSQRPHRPGSSNARLPQTRHAESSREEVRRGLVAVAVLWVLSALHHGREGGDGHGAGRGRPEPERGLRGAHVLHVGSTGAAPSMRAPKRISRVLNRVGWFIGEPRVPRWVDAASFLECPRARTEQPGRVPCVSGM